MLQLELKRSTLLWILSVTFGIGLGVEVVQFIARRDVEFPLAVVQDGEAQALRLTADSIMQARTVAAHAPIDINTATAAELETLDGIGPVLAQRIIAHREQFGSFNSVDELDDVSGIGPKRLAAIRDRCAVE